MKRGVGYILEGSSFWEGRICLKEGYIMGGKVKFTYSSGKGGIFCERGVYFGRVSYECLKWGIFWEEGVDSRIRRHLT